MTLISTRTKRPHWILLVAGLVLSTSGALAQEGVTASAGEAVGAAGILPAHQDLFTPEYLESRRDVDRGVPLLIVDQYSPSNFAGLAPSATHPDNPGADILALDDFTIVNQVALDQLVIYGLDEGGPTCNLQVGGQIWQGRPGDGGIPILLGTGNQVGSDLVINFGGQTLPPGTYLVTAFVVRNSLSGPCAGIDWNAILTSNVTERECGTWQPNGTAPAQKVSDVLQPTGPPVDMQYQLSGFLFSGEDCNANGEDDAIDIYFQTSFDTNHDGIPDECQRDGLNGNPADFDLDGIPDLDDPLPNIYNDPADDVALVDIEITQLNLVSTSPIWVSTPLSEHGAIEVTFPTVPDTDLYVNIELNGNWAVQNQHVYTTARREDTPTQTQVFFVDLGNPRGTQVNTVDARVWIDPIGFTLPPLGGPLIYDVKEGIYQIGGGGPGVPIQIDVPPAVAGPAAPAPMPMEVKTTVENEGIEVADLQWDFEKNSCAPNATGGSFEWLLRTYRLMLPANLDSVDELVQEFRVLMNTLLGKGTTQDKIKSAKEGFIRKHKLPLVVESGNIGAGVNADGLITPQQIFDEVEKGQDVELNYGLWKKDPDDGNKWKRHGGHTVAVKSVTKCVKNGVTTWKITWRHDWDQDKKGGVDDVTVGATSEDNDIDNDGTAETGWVIDNSPFADQTVKRVLESYTAESPTVSQLIKVGTELVAEYDDAVTAALADGMLTLAEAKDLLMRAEKAKKLMMRLVATLKAQMPPNQQMINDAERALQSTCNIRDGAARRVKALSKNARAILPDDDIELSMLEASSVLTVDLPDMAALNPPDADFDDVTDASDNAPLDANADQADQDLNGTPDVLELSAITDCDDNGIIDSFEVTISAVIDYLADGTPVYGFIYDLDGNGIPDGCETAPPTECTADIDGDFDVDVFDFAALAANFGSTVLIPGTDGDLDFDGDVDIFDFALFAAQFGCSP